jgi:tetratricopeptide (TPR) repeat protein
LGYTHLARIFRREGQLAEALTMQRTAVSLDNKSAPAWREMAGILEQLGRPEEAAEMLAAAQRLEDPAADDAAAQPAEGK